MDGGGDAPSKFIVLTRGVPAQELEVTAEAFTVGRLPDNQLVIEDTQISKHHCRLFLEDGHWHVEDLKSRNGTFVNGERITAIRALKPGDAVRVGAVTLQAPEHGRPPEREADPQAQSSSVKPVPAPPPPVPPTAPDLNRPNKAPAARQQQAQHTGAPQRANSFGAMLKEPAPGEPGTREPLQPHCNPLFFGRASSIETEVERCQEETNGSPEDVARRAEAEREATSIRHAKVKAVRKASGRCVMCGGDLSLLERLSGQDHHAQCTSFIEYKMPPSIGRP